MFEQRAHSFELFAATMGGTVRVSDDPADTVAAAAMTPAFLDLVRLSPQIGRAFTRDEWQTRAPVAMIGYDLWQTRYGGRIDALGSHVRVDDRMLTIVGVAPKSMAPPMVRRASPAIWTPTGSTRLRLHSTRTRDSATESRSRPRRRS